MNEITKNFLKKQPNDEEMMIFLEENVSGRQLLCKDILLIIEYLKDENNKLKAINRYVKSEVLSWDMERVLDIILNIKNHEIGERLEYIIMQRLDKLKDERKGKEIFNEKISHAILTYVQELEHTGEYNEDIEYIERAKRFLNECVELHGMNEHDLMCFFQNIDLSQWDRQDLEEYERFLNPKSYQDIMELWEEAQKEETKNLVNGVIQKAKKQKIPLKDLTKTFFDAITNEGINSDDLYEWISNSAEFNLVAEQRKELSTGEKALGTNIVEK